MKQRLSAIAIVAAAALAGCASTPDSFYTLMPAASQVSTVPDSTNHASVIVIGPITIPAMLDQAQLVITKNGNEMDVREAERWTAPLKDEVTSAMTARLSDLLPGLTVATNHQSAGNDAAIRVTIDISRFDLGPGQQTNLEALWTVKEGQAAEKTRRGRFRTSHRASTTAYGDLVAAQGKALDELANSIARTVKTEGL